MGQFLSELYTAVAFAVFLFIFGATMWDNHKSSKPSTPEEQERWERLLQELKEAQEYRAKEKSTR